MVWNAQGAEWGESPRKARALWRQLFWKTITVLIQRNAWHRASYGHQQKLRGPSGDKIMKQMIWGKKQLSLPLWWRTCGIHSHRKLSAQIMWLRNFRKHNNTERYAEQMWRGIQGIRAWQGKQRIAFPVPMWCCYNWAYAHILLWNTKGGL